MRLDGALPRRPLVRLLPDLGGRGRFPRVAPMGNPAGRAQPLYAPWGRVLRGVAMATRKMTTVSVRVSRQQAARWGGAAQYEGVASVGAWLASLASARLRYLGSFVPRLVLRWRRAHFNALRLPYFNAPEATLHEVNGIVAGCFGIYKDQDEDRRPK